MAKEPANLGALIRKQPVSGAEPVNELRQRAPREFSQPERERDLGPPRRLSFSCPPRVYLDLQIHKAHTGVAHQDIIATALEDYLKRHAEKRKG